MGYPSDRFNPWILAFSTLLVASATIFIFWGVLAHNFGGLLAFGVVESREVGAPFGRALCDPFPVRFLTPLSLGKFFLNG